MKVRKLGLDLGQWLGEELLELEQKLELNLSQWLGKEVLELEQKLEAKISDVSLPHRD